MDPWPDSCRLCMTSAAVVQHPVIRCFATADASNNYTVAEVLIKHFWFELHSERDASAFICPGCWHKVRTFHQFYQSVLALYQTRWHPPPQIRETDQSELIVEQKPEELGLSDQAVAEVVKVAAAGMQEAVDAPPVIKRKRGRPRKPVPAQPTAAPATIKLEDCSDADEFHESVAPWQCLQCCKMFASETRLEAHRRLKHEDEGEGGKLDRVPSSQQAELRADDELLRMFMAMRCDECGEEYGTFGEAKRHHRLRHGQPGYMECCGKRFLKKCRAVEHCRWHVDPKQFDCPTCSRNFTGLVALRAHTIRRHPSNAPFRYQCDQCEQRFQLIVQLRYHQQRQHLAADAKRFECYRCHRRYVFMSQLRAHLRDAHDRGPSHVCAVCAKYFQSKASYELHYALEHGGVSLKRQCPECGKWLKHAAMLARHRHQHRSGPAACADCGHVSPNKRALYTHRRLVHREPQHKCLACGKMFKKLLTLREHMAIHAGVTDLYTCAYCPKTFRSIGNMYKHRRQMHAAVFEVDRRAAKAVAEQRNAEEAAAASVAGGVEK